MLAKSSCYVYGLTHSHFTETTIPCATNRDRYIFGYVNFFQAFLTIRAQTPQNEVLAGT